jgi:hypothetical protein
MTVGEIATTIRFGDVLFRADTPNSKRLKVSKALRKLVKRGLLERFAQRRRGRVVSVYALRGISKKEGPTFPKL